MRTKGIVDGKVQNVLAQASETFPPIGLSDLSGNELATALIEHIARVGASGYSNELFVGGEVWAIGIAKGDSRWPTT